MGYRDVARVSEEVLAVCDREPIHIPESIQPHGGLMVVDVDTWRIDRISENIGEFLRQSADQLLGSCFLDLFDDPQARAIITSQVERARDRSSEGRGLLSFPAPLDRFVCECHDLDSKWLVVELERIEPIPPPEDTWDELQLLRQVSHALDEGTELTATLLPIGKKIRHLIGYDRVMFYKIDEEGHGEVIAEDKRGHLDPFLGLHFPASDIPSQARRLYIKNRVRQLCNVNYAPVGLLQANPDSRSTPLDMSLCHLRSISPVHVEYLQNMGVVATLVISIIIENRLWGLIACHHYSPRHLDATIRQECEKLAHLVTNHIRAIEHRNANRMFQKTRQLPAKLLDLVGSANDWESKFFASGFYLLTQMNASGMVIFSDDRYQSLGLVPDHFTLDKIRRVLESKADQGIYGCNSLRQESEALADVAPEHAGCLLVEVCVDPTVQMMWFRKELRQTAAWAGDPTEKSQSRDGKEVRLSPRKSFEKWIQIVEGYCTPWETLDHSRGQAIGQFVATRKMEQLSRRKSTFLRRLSKELRRPMSEALDAAADLAERKAENRTHAKLDERLSVTRKRGDEVVDVLEGILDLCCLEFGSAQPRNQEFQIAWMLQRVKTQVQRRAIEHGVGLQWAFPEPLPVCLVGDPERIEFIFDSLMHVALSQNDSAEIGIEVRNLVGSQRELAIRIEHSGSHLYWHDLGELLSNDPRDDHSNHLFPWGDIATHVRLDVARQYTRLLGGALVLEKNGSDQEARLLLRLPVGPVKDKRMITIDAHAARN